MNLDQRMQMIIAQIGSQEKLEEYYGKSVQEFEVELFDDIKEQLVAFLIIRQQLLDVFQASYVPLMGRVSVNYCLCINEQ